MTKKQNQKLVFVISSLAFYLLLTNTRFMNKEKQIKTTDVL